MNNIEQQTGGRLSTEAAHVAASANRETNAGKVSETTTQARHAAAKPHDGEPHNEPSSRDDATRRRAAYQRIAEGFMAMMDVRAMLVEGCEIDTGTEQRVTLDDALLAHFDALMMQADFFDARTIAKFYVELRMHGDALRADRTGDGNKMMDAVIDRNG
jgi:hypothetical protein